MFFGEINVRSCVVTCRPYIFNQRWLMKTSLVLGNSVNLHSRDMLEASGRYPFLVSARYLLSCSSTARRRRCQNATVLRNLAPLALLVLDLENRRTRLLNSSSYGGNPELLMQGFSERLEPAVRAAGSFIGASSQVARTVNVMPDWRKLNARGMGRRRQRELGLVYSNFGVIPKFVKRLISNCATV
jgi:hypothetical protein